MKIYNWDYRGCDVVEIQDEPVLFILPAGSSWQWKLNCNYPLHLYGITGKIYCPSRKGFYDIPQDDRIYIASPLDYYPNEGYSITFSKYGGR